MEAKCWICGLVRTEKYADAKGSVCVHCEASDKDMWAGMHADKQDAKYSKKQAAKPLFENSGLQFTEYQNGYKFADLKLVYYPSTGKLHDYGRNVVKKMTTKRFLDWMKSATKNQQLSR